MKSSGFLKRSAPLKSYSHLTMKVRVPGSLSVSKPLKRSTIKRGHTPATPQAVLDAIFSQCIRRGSADWRGYVTCVTCSSATGHWREFDCGHFQPRADIATRYDPRNCGPQCPNCNRYAVMFDTDGNPYDARDQITANFAEYIDRVHGEGVAAELVVLSETIIHNFPYKEKIQEWTEVLNKLIGTHGSDIAY